MGQKWAAWLPAWSWGLTLKSPELGELPGYLAISTGRAPGIHITGSSATGSRGQGCFWKEGFAEPVMWFPTIIYSAAGWTEFLQDKARHFHSSHRMVVHEERRASTLGLSKSTRALKPTPLLGTVGEAPRFKALSCNFTFPRLGDLSTHISFLFRLFSPSTSSTPKQ